MYGEMFIQNFNFLNLWHHSIDVNKKKNVLNYAIITCTPSVVKFLNATSVQSCWPFLFTKNTHLLVSSSGGRGISVKCKPVALLIKSNSNRILSRKGLSKNIIYYTLLKCCEPLCTEIWFELLFGKKNIFPFPNSKFSFSTFRNIFNILLWFRLGK